MKKSAFLPTADCLESRVVLSQGPHVLKGAAVLTRHALNQAESRVGTAFVQFANDGQNYARLRRDVADAVSRIPWNRRGGLVATIKSMVPTLRASVAKNGITAIGAARQHATADVQQFVQGEIAHGKIILR
jgi:hypothetical protein